MTEFHGNISSPEDSPKALSRFEMSVLKNIENIHLLGLAGDVSLPKLEVAGGLELVQTSDRGTVDMKSLSQANSLSIRGSWTRYDYTQLSGHIEIFLLKFAIVRTSLCSKRLLQELISVARRPVKFMVAIGFSPILVLNYHHSRK